MDVDKLQVSMTDHDLLITLHEQVKGLRDDIQGLGDNTKTGMDALKEDLSDKIKDHETRVRRLELWGATAVGILYALQFYFNYLK